MSIAVLTGVFEALPETDEDKCADALDRGNYLLASFHCPAGTFLSSVFRGRDRDDDEEDEENDE